MTTTTFGFDAQQDRIWMRVHDREQTVWFTRRLMGQFLGPVVQAFEQATPGAVGGAPPEQRAAIEHDLSLHETPAGQPVPQIRAGRVAPSPGSNPQQGLCTRVATRTGQQMVTMTFDTPTGPLVLPLTRRGMHLWLKGLSMVVRQAQWGLPLVLPAWLEAGVMPSALQGLVDKPVDPDGTGA